MTSSYLQSLDPQYSLISSNIHHWICAFDFTHILRNAHIFRNSYYIGLLNISSHFGNRCQWGRSLEGLRYLGFMILLHLPLMHLHPFLFVLQGCFIHYINPLKKDCHQLPKWGRLKVHGCPHVWFW